MLKSTSEKNFSKIWHGRTAVCLESFQNDRRSTLPCSRPVTSHWCLLQKGFTEEIRIFLSLIVYFNCLSVAYANFRLIEYNLMTMCCVYEMQILRSPQAAFHLNENATWQGETWFKSRGQFWQLMSWCKLSCWGIFCFNSEMCVFFSVLSISYLVRYDLFLMMVSEKVLFARLHEIVPFLA